jgi:hypothetical protein
LVGGSVSEHRLSLTPPVFSRESKRDLPRALGVQRLDAPVKSVLPETKFSGAGKVDEQTPIWKLDVK